MASISLFHSQNDTSRPSGTYTFSSCPRPVPMRHRYRGSQEANDQDDGPTRYGNLMYDRRVVRGNTYALQELPWTTEPDTAEVQKHREAHRKMLARKRAKEEFEAKAPEITDAGNRINVQTELYLEEIAGRIIEADVECQTDGFVDRPETPLYIPSKTGCDVSTQIEEGELFDFNFEVKPILEVLVGKTIEQALLEVTEEEEIANLRAHQQAYHELLNAEKAEVQRLEERERRRRVEKAQRMYLQTEAQLKQNKVKEKVAARAFALQYLKDLIPSVFSNLLDHGYFYDTVERDIEKEFLPYLMKNTEKDMEKRILGRVITDNLIREVIGNRLEKFDENKNPGLKRRHLRGPKVSFFIGSHLHSSHEQAVYRALHSANNNLLVIPEPKSVRLSSTKARAFWLWPMAGEMLSSETRALQDVSQFRSACKVELFHKADS
ncbi:radial spoke head protein 3 homolog [Sphaerodactylus townsendi]|uniref:radial spoke head protein 3 homolog n=1 Tax=Sphaerodactylus townsendi TaxID=933632 RepID=UPI0020266804|nr:radial spoke head protein 3 homolog [Sphaerodactylus townsendi]